MKFRNRLIIGTLTLCLGASLALTGCSLGHHHRTSNTAASSIHGFGYNTTGGDYASKDQTYFVADAQQLRKALNVNTHRPRRIIVTGKIDLQKGLGRNSYTKGTNYNFKRYLRSCRKLHVSQRFKSQQFAARRRAQRRQAKQINLNVPANTSLIGAQGAQLKNAALHVNHDNVVIRNLTLSAPVDNFPRWTRRGWQSYFNSITVGHAKHVQIDHDVLTDSPVNDNLKKRYLGRFYNQHRDLIHVTGSADDVMISDNLFSGHNRALAIGSRNDESSQPRLNVSVIHNHFANTAQQTPWIRGGRVEIVKNWYTNNDHRPYRFTYAWGINQGSRVYSRDNVFDVRHLNVNHVVSTAGDYRLTAVHTKVNGKDRDVTAGLNSRKQHSFGHRIPKSILTGRYGIDIRPN